MKKTQDSLIHSGLSREDVARDLEPLVDFEENGLSLEELAGLIERALVPHLMKYDSPRFQSFFNAFPERGAEYGARLGLAFNQGVTNWQVSPGGAMLEELCGRALCRLFGLKDGSDATFMYCGTYANQQAIYMALHRRAERRGFNLAEKGLAGFGNPDRLAVIASTQAHFSLRHAVRMLGLGEQSLVLAEVDRNHRLDVGRLAALMKNLKKDEGREVFCLVATAGTTSTGSVDPVEPMIRICRDHDIWLHVDGAYGLAYSLVPECRHFFAGIDEADSVSWDPHKQLGIPIPNSLLFVRCREDFARMAIYGEYFNRRGDPNPNPGLKSPPSTRPMSALPLAASLRFQGLAGVVERLRAPLRAIKAAADKLKDVPGIELVNEPETGVLGLRIVPPGVPAAELDGLQQRIYEKINSEGRRSISITRIDGRAVLRLVAVSPQVTEAALLETVARMRSLSTK